MSKKEKEKKCPFYFHTKKFEKENLKETVLGDGSIQFEVEGYASRPEKDASGDIVVPLGIDMKRYMNNPIIKRQHYRGEDNNIGVVHNYKINEEGLYIYAKIILNPDIEDHKKLIHGLRHGLILGFSIGFIPKDSTYNKEEEANQVNEIEIYEISIVDIPDNPLTVRKALSIGPRKMTNSNITFTNMKEKNKEEINENKEEINENKEEINENKEEIIEENQVTNEEKNDEIEENETETSSDNEEKEDKSDKKKELDRTITKDKNDAKNEDFKKAENEDEKKENETENEDENKENNEEDENKENNESEGAEEDIQEVKKDEVNEENLEATENVESNISENEKKEKDLKNNLITIEEKELKTLIDTAKGQAEFIKELEAKVDAYEKVIEKAKKTIIKRGQMFNKKEEAPKSELYSQLEKAKSIL